MANISKLQFLRTETAKKVPTAAQLDEGSLAINIADKNIFTKDSKGAIVQLGYSQSETDAKYALKTTTINGKPLSGNIALNSNDTGSLAISNRFSELSGQGIINLKAMLDNIEVESMRPMPLEQFQGTGVVITSLGDTRLTEKNQTVTINSSGITDGPIGYSSQLSASVLVNIRRAYNAGMVLAQYLYTNGGVSFVRTSGSITTVGDWKWNGLTSGADANGWRKNFDSAVLPSLAELGAAKSGVNSDITQLNNVSLINGDTDFAGSIYQTGGARTFQNNYRIGLIREANPNGNVNPYITFIQKDIGDGDLLPKSNRVIGRIESKVASPTTDDYGGRSIGAYQQWLDPAGNGITQIATYDANGANTMIDLYSATGNIGIKNRDINGQTTFQGTAYIGSLTNLTNAPANGQYLLGVATRDTGTSGAASTYIGHNGGTTDAPVYSHYFRGKGTTSVDTQLGLRVAKDTNLLGALNVTGESSFAKTNVSGLLTANSLSLTSNLSIPNGGTGAATAPAARTNLGLGTAAIVNTGTSGATIPLLSTANTWSATQAFGNISVGAANTGSTGLELGSTTTAGSSFIDFHSSGTTSDFDARIVSTGGSSTTLGKLGVSAFGLTLTDASNVGGFVSTSGTTNGFNTYRLSTSTGKSVFQRWDGNDWYFMISDTVDGSYNGLRPIRISGTTGGAEFQSVRSVGDIIGASGVIGTYATSSAANCHYVFRNPGGDNRAIIYCEQYGFINFQAGVTSTTGNQSTFQMAPTGIFNAPNGSQSVNGRVRAFSNVASTYLEVFVDGNSKGINFFDSDETLKENIENADSKKALDIIENIRPVSYKFKDYNYTTTEKDDEGNDVEVNNVQKGGEHQYGVIAQEFEKILPEGVITHADGKKALDPLEVLGLLMTTCHEQQKIIRQLQVDVEKLKK